MSDLPPVQGQITFTADVTGIEQAESSLSNFGNTWRNIMSVAGGMGLVGLFNNVSNGISSAISDISNFQNATTAIGVTLDNIGTTGNDTMNQLAGGSSKLANIAQEEADATIKYQEKVADLNSKIAEALAGQNVIDAQNNLTDQLDSLAEQHNNKLASLSQQITDAKMNESNTLADMQDSHDVKMADMAEKHEIEMENATSDIQKAALQKKYDEQVKYENDSFQRQYDLRQKELDRQVQQKEDQIKRETDAENKAYDEKVAKDKEKSEDEIAKLKDQNEKKVELYRQELADEERAYHEHMGKLQESAASGGGAAAKAFTKPLSDDSIWKAPKESLQQFMDFVNKVSSNTPFQFKDIVEYGRLVEAMGYNFQALEPVISNIAAGTGRTFGVTTQALLDAVNGRFTMMQMELGITKEQLMQFGAHINPKTMHVEDVQSLLDAFQKISQTKFAGATDRELHTMSGAFSDVQDAIFKTEAAFLGMDTQTAQSHGLFKLLTDAMLGFANFLNTHQKDIFSFIDAMTPLLEVIGLMAAMITVLAIPAMILWSGVMTAKLVNALISFITTGWQSIPMMLDMSLGADALSVSLLGIDIPIGIVMLGIAGLILVGYELVTHWQSVAKAGTQAWNTIGNAIRDVIRDAIGWINKLIEGLDKITGGKINIHPIDLGTAGNALSAVTGIPGLGNFLTAKDSTNTWNLGSQNWQANPLEGSIGNIFNTLLNAGGTTGKASPAGLSSMTGGFQAIQNMAGGGQAAAAPQITNYNTFNTPYDPTNFAKELGLQIQLQH